MAKRLLPLIPPSLVVNQVHLSSHSIQICCRFRSPAAQCPDCGVVSQRLHSYYKRQLADLPWQGHVVTISLTVRRLRCANMNCTRRIFAEHHSDLTWRYCRRTRRLGEVQRCVGLALGGEAGARLVARLGMPTSADTLIRAVRTDARSIRSHPRILGVDDWAWRRGQRYGTVLVDLETNDVVDLLPDREMGSLSAWLSDHPSVEIIARDRAGAYARGAREGAPQAQQIADRWHLLRNCSDALQNVVERQYRLVRDVGKTLLAEFSGSSPPSNERLREPILERQSFKRRTDQHEERNALFNEVVRLNSIGWSQLASNASSVSI